MGRGGNVHGVIACSGAGGVQGLAGVGLGVNCKAVGVAVGRGGRVLKLPSAVHHKLQSGLKKDTRAAPQRRQKYDKSGPLTKIE